MKVVSLFPVKPGLSNTNTLAEVGQGGCNDAGTAPLVTTGKERSVIASPKSCYFPGSGKSRRFLALCTNWAKKEKNLAGVHGRTLISHTPAQTPFAASMDFWDIIGISCQFPLCKSYENLCRHTGERRKCSYNHPETLELWREGHGNLVCGFILNKFIISNSINSNSPCWTWFQSWQKAIILIHVRVFPVFPLPRCSRHETGAPKPGQKWTFHLSHHVPFGPHVIPTSLKKHISYYSIGHDLHNGFKISPLPAYRAGLWQSKLLVSGGIFHGNELQRRKLWESVKHAVNSGLKRGISWCTSLITTTE